MRSIFIRAVLLRATVIVLAFLIGSERCPAEVDVWRPDSIDSDWQSVSKLQRVPLFDKEIDASLSPADLLRHRTPIVRLAAATAIVQTKQEALYDQVLGLCRDDWPFISEKALDLLLRANDKRRNQRLIKAGSFSDWELHPRKPYSKIYHGVGLPTTYTPNSYWAWHDQMQKLRADAKAGRKIQRAKRNSLFRLSSAERSVGCLDKSVGYPGGKIIYRVRRHRHTNFDTRIRGFQGALEQGKGQSRYDSQWQSWFNIPQEQEDQQTHYAKLIARWPRMRRVRQQFMGEFVEEDYEITISSTCRPGDYCVGWRNYHACFRVLRSSEAHDRIELLATGTPQEMVRSVVDMRSPIAFRRVAKLLDEIPLDKRRSPDTNGIAASGYWELLSLIGTEAAAAKLLTEREYFGTCMVRSPRSALSKMGVVTQRPALEVLRDWKNQESEAIAMALSVLGPTALRDETELLKEIVQGTTQKVQRLHTQVVETRKDIEAQQERKAEAPDDEETGGGYSIEQREFSRLSENYSQQVDILNTVLSKLRSNEREFVLKTLLTFTSEPRILSSLIPSSFVRADPSWVADQLWQKTKSQPDGTALGKATVLGFARARVTSDTWIRSLDFPITCDGDLIWFQRSVRPALRSDLNRRIKEYESIRKPSNGGAYFGE